MRYYFEDKEHEEQLGKILRSWMGTPFRHWSGVKGLGCDCIHFVTEVLQELGVYSKQGGKYKIMRYPKDWHLHREQQFLADGVLFQVPADEVDPDSHVNGDILLFQFGRAISHTSFYFNGFLYHSIAGIGVRKSSYEVGDWKERQKHNLRVLAV